VCGRFVQTSSAERLAATFSATDTTAGQLRPRYNVAPSTAIPAIISGEDRRLGMLRWGFLPSWARDPDDGPRPINARVEGAATSRLFASSLKRRRCIVPVDAWYEWTEEDGARQPWLIRPESDDPVAVAALWSTWRPVHATPDEPPLATVALITTEAHGPCATVHHRMPLVVPDVLLEPWLDLSAPADETLIAALRSTELPVEVWRVSRRVNDVRNEGADLLTPAPPPAPSLT
jgi:putative SOS response-associated peptidase YedK